MARFNLPRLAELDEAAITRFQANGFLIVERVLDPGRIAATGRRIAPQAHS